MDPVVAFFILGILARAIRSDLRMPEALYETLTIYLLLAIGLKGGMALAADWQTKLLWQALAVMAFGAALAAVAYPLLQRLVRLGAADAASVAAHYGSVSVVTFAVGLNALRSQGVEPEPELTLFLALMEVPGILVGVLLAKRISGPDSGAPLGHSSWSGALVEALRGKSVVLLLGGLAIGALFGKQALAPIAPMFEHLFKGALALFLLELGLIVAGKWPDIKNAGWRLAAFGVAFPVAAAMAGIGLGNAFGLSAAGAALLGTLGASASYIAAPAAMRVAVPQANPALGIAAALGITFAFNVAVGIPLYWRIATALGG
ncbi:MAG TPA: sodium-dependent bicarbonate transport family permease [Gammaproteobacteria bacterium]|uniref:sodium-dependent bicarbonate transport family permease n=1 Tax=Immundisolibacter sp. TaxID=1934948 RepID=UPI000E8FEAB5|nr:sodium-dependent bicarbonate transport family permease [Gammaproteobacteria bacterium]HCZ48174.1 sodium-dependent bicarbonate transport family permease [Gammaproteobacteria bacterium]MCH77612.1 sodium-dependent bicarbonate transport family permease [Gammaproteobacteria bacterium]